MGSQGSLAHCSEAGSNPSPLNLTEQGIPPKRMGSKKPVWAVGVSPGLTTNGHTVCPSCTTATHIWIGPMLGWGRWGNVEGTEGGEGVGAGIGM